MVTFKVKMPDILFGKLQKEALVKNIKLVELIKEYFRLGLVISQIIRDGDKIIIRENDGEERELRL